MKEETLKIRVYEFIDMGGEWILPTITNIRPFELIGELCAANYNLLMEGLRHSAPNVFKNNLFIASLS